MSNNRHHADRRGVFALRKYASSLCLWTSQDTDLAASSETNAEVARKLKVGAE